MVLFAMEGLSQAMKSEQCLPNGTSEHSMTTSKGPRDSQDSQIGIESNARSRQSTNDWQYMMMIQPINVMGQRLGACG
jgi:hypothetical protein